MTSKLKKASCMLKLTTEACLQMLSEEIPKRAEAGYTELRIQDLTEDVIHELRLAGYSVEHMKGDFFVIRWG
jgi:hypothetical protein